MKKRILSMVLTLCIALAAYPVTIMAANTSAFLDISSNDYYADAVAWAVEKEITNGTSTTTFSPDNGCTRAQVVTFLWRYAGSPKVYSSSKFGDVMPGQYYSDAVAWAVSKGITNGTSTTTFSPDDTCTRGQIVTFLWRYAGKPSASSSGAFADVPAGEYYTDAVAWAVSNRITNGTGAASFSPNNTCTRGQIVTFLWRYSGEGSLPADSINLNHSYTTKWGKTYAVTYPAFTFNYPDGWTVTSEDVSEPKGSIGISRVEFVELTNSRGTTITYAHMFGAGEYGGPDGNPLGGNIYSMREEKIFKVADSSFVPSYVQADDLRGLGKFMVAKVQCTATYDMLASENYTPLTDGSYHFAVMPESYAGTYVRTGTPMLMDSFCYGCNISFLAIAPETGFTMQEEKEVIAVLSSFRIAP